MDKDLSAVKSHPYAKGNNNMTERPIETDTSFSQQRISRASAYSACIQEAMRFDRLRSSDYLLVMTILHAVLQGYTEEHWQEEQQRSLDVLCQQRPDPQMSHADEANRYEQTVSYFKDLLLWPW
jgi:hypothetical protein